MHTYVYHLKVKCYMCFNRLSDVWKIEIWGRKLTMFPAASEQCKVEDEVNKNYKFDIFCTCWMLEIRKRMA